MNRFTLTHPVRTNRDDIEYVQFEVVLDLHDLAKSYAQKAYDNKGQRVREAKGAIVISVID